MIFLQPTSSAIVWLSLPAAAHVRTTQADLESQKRSLYGIAKSEGGKKKEHDTLNRVQHKPQVS